MKSELVDWGKTLIVPSSGVAASFSLANQFLGTVAAILSICFVIWKWRMDSKKYSLDQKNLDDMNNHVEEIMKRERQVYDKLDKKNERYK